MPTYEYRCTQCGHRFERWQSITADPIAECPECRGVPKRVIFPVGILFKGSGFYVTDNRQTKGDEGSPSSGASSSASGSSSSSGDGSNGDKGGKKESKSEPAKAASS